MHGNHIKHMLIGGAALLALLLLAGVPVGRAFSYAVVLACPLMMIWMMRSMGSGHTPAARRYGDQGDEVRDQDGESGRVRHRDSSTPWAQ